MEQIRVIREMRNEFTRQLRVRGSDVDRRLVKPRFMVWENVPGAFSSNKGEDFRVVLEETAKVADENAVIPRPANGKWTSAGLIMGDGWSIAYRQHDAQWWGVPQRRKRICMVADFNGESAGEILFELLRETDEGNSESSFTDSRDESRPEIQSVGSCVSGNNQSSREEGEGTPESIEGCPDNAIKMICLEGNGSRDSHKGDGYKESDTMYTLNTVEQHGVAYGLDRASFNQGRNAQYDFSVDEELAPPIIAKGPGGGNAEKVSALCARDWKGVGNQYVTDGKLIIQDIP